MVLEVSTVFTLVGGVRSYHDGNSPWERLSPCFHDSHYKERTVCRNQRIQLLRKQTWQNVERLLETCKSLVPGLLQHRRTPVFLEALVFSISLDLLSNQFSYLRYLL